MLRTYKDHLKDVAKSNETDFQNRVYRRLQYRVAPGETKHYADGLRSLILVMPDLVAQIQWWANDKSIPREEKSLIGYLLTYLHHPMDVIPYRSTGLFGYLEDAYLTGALFHRIATILAAGSQPPINKDVSSLIQNIPQWLEMAKKVIPGETKKMDQMIHDLVHHDTQLFAQEMAARTPQSVQTAPNPSLRSMLHRSLGSMGLENQLAAG